MARMEIKCTIFTILQLFHLTPAPILRPINKKLMEAFEIAFGTTNDFYEMFQQCVDTYMPNEQFITDDLHSYVNYPMKTTIGSSPKFTSNRKFFANLISTPAFKETVAKDVNEIRLAYHKKMQYCDKAILDQSILRDFYDHEVDQTKV